jgi:phosphoribosylformimino-5-aminoimidazole carboxamide ribotide isomerase
VIVIPAVDLRAGRCVRLREGRPDLETVFADDPVAMATRWARLGAARLHVVDLDGAFAGAPRQTALIAAVVEAVAPVPVEVGGGLRDVGAVEAVLAAGARWAVVGTRAALDPAFLRGLCGTFPDRIIVAVDGRGSRVAVKGWTETADETVLEMGRRAEAAGAAALLFTDVSRDGTGEGPNLEETGALARAVTIPLIASGGVGSLADLLRLAAVPGVAGTVVGRALYTGALDLPAAVEALADGARPQEAANGIAVHDSQPGGASGGDASSRGGGASGGGASSPPDR